MAEIPATTTELRCYRHPDRETMLRCSRCERPICPNCAKQTPTGYRCPECIRGQQKAFDTTQWSDYPVAFVLAGGLSLAGSFVVGVMGFFTIFLAPLAGVIIAEVVRWAVRKRRSPNLFRLAAAATALGALPLLGIQLVGVLIALSAGGGIGSIFGIIWSAVYAVLATSTAYYRLSGIQLR